MMKSITTRFILNQRDSNDQSHPQFTAESLQDAEQRNLKQRNIPSDTSVELYTAIITSTTVELSFQGVSLDSLSLREDGQS